MKCSSNQLKQYTPIVWTLSSELQMNNTNCYCKRFSLRWLLFKWLELCKNLEMSAIGRIHWKPTMIFFLAFFIKIVRRKQSHLFYKMFFYHYSVSMAVFCIVSFLVLMLQWMLWSKRTRLETANGQTCGSLFHCVWLPWHPRNRNRANENQLNKTIKIYDNHNCNVNWITNGNKQQQL